MSGTLTFLDRGTAAWDKAWQALEEIEIRQHGVLACLRYRSARTMLDPESGEAWQYLGTIDGRHEFRHRMHPITRRREYRRPPTKEPKP